MMSDYLNSSIANGNIGFPLTKAFKNKQRYYDDFEEMMEFFSENLAKSDYSDIEKKVISGSNSDEQTYLQTMCELRIPAGACGVRSQ